MSIVQTYHTMMKRLQTIVSHERITRICVMAWLATNLPTAALTRLHYSRGMPVVIGLTF